jgi:hypothetical protein
MQVASLLSGRAGQRRLCGLSRVGRPAPSRRGGCPDLRGRPGCTRGRALGGPDLRGPGPSRVALPTRPVPSGPSRVARPPQPGPSGPTPHEARPPVGPARAARPESPAYAPQPRVARLAAPGPSSPTHAARPQWPGLAAGAGRPDPGRSAWAAPPTPPGGTRLHCRGGCPDRWVSAGPTGDAPAQRDACAALRRPAK